MPAGKDLDKHEHEKVAICTLDPGTTSGVARGIFKLHETSVWEGLTNGKFESYEVSGTPARQAWEIIGEYADWTEWPEHKRMKELGVVRYELVFEDFVVRLGRGAASKRSLLDPVRVVNACEALCLTRQGLQWAFPIYQQPSAAMNFATDERLREHKMWVKGSTHRRDAVRHLCRRYAVLIGALKDK